MDWSRYRAEMPITERWAFFDHAAVAPLTLRAQNALADYAQDLAENGDVNERRWVERIEHVRLAEIDLHRPAARPLPVIALEVPIDALAGDLERHSQLGPAGHELEGRTDDPDQMAVVFSTEIRLYLAAIVCNPQSEFSND